MQTEQLRTMGVDFARRVSALEWPTDGFFLAGIFPSTGPHTKPGQQTISEHVILIAPAREGEPPVPSLARSRRGPDDWIRVSPYVAEVMDMDLFYETLATAPPPNSKPSVNVIVVHYTRRGQDGGSMRCLMAHNDELDQPGGSEKLTDDAWVHSAFPQWLEG